MSKLYDVKLQNHQKFDEEDIKSFCIDQVKENGLDDYITKFIIDKVLFGLAGYSEDLKLVCLDTDFLKHYKEFKKGFKSKNLIDRFLTLDADVFNLFIMETIYHEIHHAKQTKEMNNNPNSDYAILLSASCLFAPKSGTTYTYYHDRYFFEYDSIINSILFILDYIKDFDIDKRALQMLNRSWAVRLLNGYGIDIIYNTNSSYKSPIDFFKFFFDEKFYIAEKDKPVLGKLADSITNYTPDDDITSLVRGYSIPETYIKRITDIATGKIKITNIFEELKAMEKIGIQK